jgi:probable phosphoglycerate mutase
LGPDLSDAAAGGGLPDAEPTRIVVVRHGETDWNAEARLQGQLDVPLNALGRRQAATLPDALRHDKLVAVYASDRSRAWATAQALAGPLGLPLAADPGLRERCFGALEGQTRQQIDQQQPALARRWHGREPDFAPLGAESLRRFQQRCLAAVERLAAAHAGSSIALVSHGGVLDCLYRAATRTALHTPRSWPLGNAGINRLLVTPQGFTLIGWGDSAHLDALARDEPAA